MSKLIGVGPLFDHLGSRSFDKFKKTSLVLDTLIVPNINGSIEVLKKNKTIISNEDLRLIAEYDFLTERSVLFDDRLFMKDRVTEILQTNAREKLIDMIRAGMQHTAAIKNITNSTEAFRAIAENHIQMVRFVSLVISQTNVNDSCVPLIENLSGLHTDQKTTHIQCIN